MNTTPIVPRIEDLPYHTSPPIQFVYTASASLLFGFYTWANAPSVLTPTRPLMANTLYYFRSITFSANIEEVAYTANLSTTPAFQMYLKSRAKATLFREPVLMVKYLQNFDFRFAWFTQNESDQLYASFNGILAENADLVGISSISLTAVISAQEVVDENFIQQFKKNYPSQ